MTEWIVQHEPAQENEPQPRRLPFGLPARWLGAAGATVLAGIVGVALAVQSGAGAACAAPPTGSTVHKGKATLYDLQNLGNCSMPAPDDAMFAALGPAEYAAAAACGSYLDVTGPKGKVRVKVIDQCPECAPGHVDLSRAAFTKIADPVQGIVPVTYRAAGNAAAPGPLTFRIKEGASQFFFAVLVDNHANPLRSVEARGPGGGWRNADRQDFNYWLVQSGLGAGPYSLRVTDVYGRQATVTGITMSPGKVQRTDVQLSGSAAAPEPPVAAAPPRQPGKPTPRPAASRATAGKPAAERPASAPTTKAAVPDTGVPATALPTTAPPATALPDAGVPAVDTPPAPGAAEAAPGQQAQAPAGVLAAGDASCR